uniref:Uncharacterized protein n=1 Tax=Cryptomonas curvata TaxID=233186 RepID=A0A7S0MLM6_9CRYP|mmetsp:Transcript_43657/g.91402  ORF Transcript_43657/g.91402 Transcript_43657/m.91402 type:complete len:150 (+) Transcript_43657:57-506(+)
MNTLQCQTILIDQNTSRRESKSSISALSMDSIKRIWINDFLVNNIQNGSNEPRQLQSTGFTDFLIYDSVQNAADSGLDYLEAEAGLNYLLGDGEELDYTDGFSQQRFIWNGIEHARLSGLGDYAAGEVNHARQARRLPSAALRSLSNSI